MGLTLLNGKIQQYNQEPKNNPILHFINGGEAAPVYPVVAAVASLRHKPAVPGDAQCCV